MSIVSDADYESNVYVQKADAEMRAESVSSVSYKTVLCLPKGENFLGRTTVNLSLKKAPAKPLFLDFRGVSIANLTINGTVVQEDATLSSFRKHKVFLPTQHLQVGEDKTNTVVISFYNKYRKDGCGLHSFSDEADGEQYIYT